MKKMTFIISILLFSFVFSQTLHVIAEEKDNQYELENIQQLSFTDLDTLLNSSLSVHTVNGIKQVKLRDIDYVFLREGMMRIHHAGILTEFRHFDIKRVNIATNTLPNRSDDALSGAEFMNSILETTFAEREPLILKEFLEGNIPDLSREFISLTSVFNDANGNAHTLEYDVMSDYLSIGTNEDYCRVPMGPSTAQKIADAYGCILTTSKLCDDIWKHATVKLSPIPYAPVGDNNSQVYKFIEHNRDINAARDAVDGEKTELIAGIKKDVVICNTINSKPGYVCIYGWHYTSGSPIQPLYTGHVDWYVDYSHGIRLVNEYMKVDGVIMSAHDILKDPVLYKLISSESAPMQMTKYRY